MARHNPNKYQYLEEIMISGVILMTVWLPLQVFSHAHQAHRVNPFFLVGAFVDCARIVTKNHKPPFMRTPRSFTHQW